MKFTTTSDMGSIKIYNHTMAIFFNNHKGDVPNVVKIRTSQARRTQGEYLSHFTVRDTAYLSAYDCSDQPLYTFSKGRWFVYLNPEGFVIEKKDEDLNA